MSIYIPHILLLHTCVLVTSITAPVGGVLAGGWVIDRAGGYSDAEGIYRSLKLIVCAGIIAVAAALPASYLNNVRHYIH